MTENDRDKGVLRQLPPNHAAWQQLFRYHLLSATQEVVLGRDPECDIVLDSHLYGMVSRRHAVIRPLPQSAKSYQCWLIYDLDSVNGTYVNGQRLHSCQELQVGDRISLGSRGAEFIFESDSQSLPAVPLLPTAGTQEHWQNSSSSVSEPPVSLTQLLPILSTGRDLTRKAYLLPGIFTVVFVVLMFATVGQPETAFYNQLLVATYLAAAAYYFVYQLCGKHKPWWVLLSTALATGLLLLSPLLSLFIFIFRDLLPGSIPSATTTVSFPELLMRMFFGAGLMEELLKALPLLAAYLIGRRLQSPWRERIGIWEPLDGILLGSAAAVGFTLLETLGQYVPEMTRSFSLQPSTLAVGQLAGLQLLIPRVLGSIAGHMAYSGYLGYFIGLSVLKPRQGWLILVVGYISAAALHALWNSTGSISGLLLTVVGVSSYACLTAAILKARALSPTRSQNFATRFWER